MAQKWDYAELSKAAKQAGGPEKFVEMLEAASKKSGKIEDDTLAWCNSSCDSCSDESN